MAEDDWVRKAQADGHDVAQVMQRAAKAMLADAEAPRQPELQMFTDEIWVAQERLRDGSWQSRVVSPVMQDAVAFSETDSFAAIRFKVAQLWARAQPSVAWEEHRARANRAEFRRA